MSRGIDGFSAQLQADHDGATEALAVAETAKGELDTTVSGYNDAVTTWNTANPLLHQIPTITSPDMITTQIANMIVESQSAVDTAEEIANNLSDVFDFLLNNDSVGD